jgi:hypothetical protein
MNYANGIVIKLWNIQRIQAFEKRYRVKLPSGSSNRILYTMKDRDIFKDGELIAYQEDGVAKLLTASHSIGYHHSQDLLGPLYILPYT